jgi:acyl dehydratase
VPIRADAVGTELEPASAEVEARELLAYAAGIGETSEVCFDDARPGGLVATPAFCVSLEWPVVRSRAGSSPLGETAEELRRGVHASQDSCFHRPIRPGDRLETRGRIVEVRPTRAGAFVMTRLETVGARGGAPVVTSWYGSIFRDVAVAGEARRLDAPPPLPTPRESAAGDLERIGIPIAREAPHLYTECARIWNPIHTERRVALAAGLPDVILHGTATWALAARELVRRRGAGDPTRLRRLAGRFAAMVIPGTSIVVELGPLEGGVVALAVRNAAGELALAQGVAELAPAASAGSAARSRPSASSSSASGRA